MTAPLPPDKRHKPKTPQKELTRRAARYHEMKALKSRTVDLVVRVGDLQFIRECLAFGIMYGFNVLPTNAKTAYARVQEQLAELIEANDPRDYSGT